MRNLGTYIFDQDGTLYPRSTSLAIVSSGMTRDWLLSNIQPPIPFEELRGRFPNFTDALQHYHLSLSQWHQEVCNPLSTQISMLIERDQRLVDFLASLPNSQYLVTLSSAQFTEELLSVLGLRDRFKRVFNLRSSDKGSAYSEIRQIEGIEPHEIGVFGDNDEIDLKPARDQGMKTFLVDPDISITEQYE